MDTWVLRVGIAIPLLCIAGLGLWHILAYLVQKLPKKRRARRSSPEPPSSIQSLKLPPHGPVASRVDSNQRTPEHLQQACTDLEAELAETYWHLAESWYRDGHPRKAAAAFKRFLQICPDSPRARSAQERLRQIAQEEHDPYS
jgi:hypothetical protein